MYVQYEIIAYNLLIYPQNLPPANSPNIAERQYNLVTWQMPNFSLSV